MARQRFIWPTIWDDPDLGRLSSDARLLYIGCFSLADDDGRILGDPVYLATQIFRYRTSVKPAAIVKLRDEIAASCKSFVVYEKDGQDVIAFLNWSEFQKPKYPRPSKLPPPPVARGRRRNSAKLPEIDANSPSNSQTPNNKRGRATGRKPASANGKSSGNVPEGFPERSPAIPPRVGLGLYPPTPHERKTRRRRPKQTAPEPGYPCPHCGARQRTQGELDDHVKYIHFEQADPADTLDDDPLPF